MEKNLQDRAWACLPKEARDKIKIAYKSDYVSDRGYQPTRGMEVLQYVFGHHNLTSDTEPSELLVVERKKVHEYKADIEFSLAGSFSSEYSKGYWRGQQTALDRLFGDKCLSDKEESVQDEPRFREGVLVKCLLNGEIYEVEGKSGKYHYALKGFDYDVHEDNLEPYTEPETKDNVDEIDEALYGKDMVSPKDEEEIEEMEEKELNLCELLKGCEGETFYSRAYGEVTLNEIVRDDRPNSQEIKVYTPDPQSDRIWFLRNGRKHKNGEIDLYPSRALYEKYPLDAYSAWMEWQESRKPKMWSPKDNEEYWFVNNLLNAVSSIFDEEELEDRARVDAGNCFQTQELAQQAAEGIREYLKTFHKKHKEQ